MATECATFDAVAGEQYYVVVDGYEGAMGSFDLDVTCPSTAEICDNGVDDDANGVADCDDAACAESLGCGNWEMNTTHSCLFLDSAVGTCVLAFIMVARSGKSGRILLNPCWWSNMKRAAWRKVVC